MTILTANWHWPQWTMLIFLLLGMMIGATHHGKPQAPYNGFVNVIRFGVIMFILSAGGFFS